MGSAQRKKLAVTINPNATTTTTISVSVDHIPVKISVPPGAFATPVQITVTAPVLSQITGALSSLGYSGYQAVSGLGVSVINSSGHLYSGSFLKPITTTVDDSAISSASRVVEWNALGQFTSVSSATVASGSATWSFQHDPAFAVISPTTTVPGATSPVTGKPFLMEGSLGALFIVGGASLLWQARRRNPS